MKLALYKGKGTAANTFIRWWTQSEYSHCELVVDGKWYSSSVMDGGVRCKEIDPHPDSWDFIDITWVEDKEVVSYFRATDYQRYGWWTLIFSQLFNRSVKFRHAQFCSEWCAAALSLPSSATFSPKVLGQLCEYLGTRAKLWPVNKGLQQYGLYGRLRKTKVLPCSPDSYPTCWRWPHRFSPGARASALTP